MSLPQTCKYKVPKSQTSHNCSPKSFSPINQIHSNVSGLFSNYAFPTSTDFILKFLWDVIPCIPENISDVSGKCTASISVGA
jgi:hypothetical protein